MKKLERAAVTPSVSLAGIGWAHALRGALVLMVLCGVLYPLIAVSIGAALFPRQSAGSLMERDGVTIGSALVGQPFAAAGYFQGRPSAVNYDPFAVAGSNEAPSNPDLRRRAAATSKSIAASNGIAPDRIPLDLVAASGSGIDPHISPEAAGMQVARVARARHLPPAAVAALVARFLEPPVLGVLGQPRVNVLALNLELDRISAGDRLANRSH